MENVSRRRVLKLSAGVLGGGSASRSRQFLGQRSDPTVEGWITKGDEATIAETRATIESFRHSGSSLCNDGDVFKCRTCSGVEFFLLVPSESSQLTVGETYRFSPTGKENTCGNFQVGLFEANPCGRSAEPTVRSDAPATETTTTETTTETPTETTTETTTTETTTTETTTDTTTTSTTETTTTETPDTPIDAPTPETTTDDD